MPRSTIQWPSHAAGAPCVGQPLLPEEPSDALVREAVHFLKRSYRPIAPRKRAPDYTAIPADFQLEEGRALCVYGDAGWGHLVKRGKDHDGHFANELVEAIAEMIRDHWSPSPMPEWVTCVPSLRHPDLVPSLARRLAGELGLPFVEAIHQTRETDRQRHQQNSHYRRENLRGAFSVEVPPRLAGHDVLLVDGVVDSRWTLTVLGAQLRSRGAGHVHPVALAEWTGS